MLPVAIALAIAIALSGCSHAPSSPDPSEAIRLAEPHAAAYQEFEVWARRTVVADPELGSRASLEETLFAPVRRKPAIVALWVVRKSATGREVRFSLPAKSMPPPSVRWVHVRAASLGPHMRVGLGDVPDRHGHGGVVRSVLLARTEPGPSGDGVTVIVAFRLADEGAK